MARIFAETNEAIKLTSSALYSLSSEEEKRDSEVDAIPEDIEGEVGAQVEGGGGDENETLGVGEWREGGGGGDCASVARVDCGARQTLRTTTSCQ